MIFIRVFDFTKLNMFSGQVYSGSGSAPWEVLVIVSVRFIILDRPISLCLNYLKTMGFYWPFAR